MSNLAVAGLIVCVFAAIGGPSWAIASAIGVCAGLAVLKARTQGE